MLEEHGYAVDQYPGEKATVELYRNLPGFGYDILILRTHASSHDLRWGQGGTTLFTGEEYSFTQHTRDQLTGRVSMVGHPLGRYEGNPGPYFGISPSFVSHLDAEFNDALVFVMGCQGMTNDTLARSFLDQGAEAYVGWDNEVTAHRTDTATLWWLHDHLKGASLEEATVSAMSIAEADDQHESTLRFMERTGAASREDAPVRSSDS